MDSTDLKELIIRGEKCTFLIGTILGQMSSLLNQIRNTELDNQGIYRELIDIQNQAALQVNAIYYSKKE